MPPLAASRVGWQMALARIVCTRLQDRGRGSSPPVNPRRTEDATAIPRRRHPDGEWPAPRRNQEQLPACRPQRERDAVHRHRAYASRPTDRQLVRNHREVNLQPLERARVGRAADDGYSHPVAPALPLVATPRPRRYQSRERTTARVRNVPEPRLTQTTSSSRSGSGRLRHQVGGNVPARACRVTREGRLPTELTSRRVGVDDLLHEVRGGSDACSGWLAVRVSG